ncbi:MAG: amidohydrolase [Bacteroidetes bacterium]|nr:amidohydrolase [Bacteroidota bacterium]
MCDLKISLIQTQLYWEDVPANLHHFHSMIQECPAESDLILLPEMFNTGFTMKADQFAELMSGETVQWLTKQAKIKNAAIAGSLIISENDKFFNRFVCAFPDGTTKAYDKRHRFSMGNEDKDFSAGTERVVFEINGWRIFPQVCYDLRFPVWSRNLNHYDVLIYVANWPEVRTPQWTKLLQARAIENQCYVAAVNRIGRDGNGMNHIGASAVIDFMGEPIVSYSESSIILNATLKHEELMNWRERFPVMKDADSFDIRL